MSMPVGQSRAQPLQDRHRSRASCTSGDFQPSWIDLAVDHLLQDPGPAAGGVLLLPGRLVGRAHHPEPRGDVRQALADAGAVVHLLARSGRGDPAAPEPAGRRPPACGSTSTPGLSRLCGSKACLTCPNSASAAAEYIAGSRADRARPSPCSPDIEPPWLATSSRRLLDEAPVDPGASGRGQREVDPDVHAAVPEVSVGQTVEPVLGQQPIEVAQVGPEVRRRDGGVLPAR